MRLYHTTLSENAQSIDKHGLRLNTAKAERPNKAFTDVFNYVFNEKAGLYLPQEMQDLTIDRNEAIFLSAHPEEFKKSQNLSGYEKDKDKQDVTYEVEIDKDLPLFDSGDFTKWTEGLTEGLNGIKLISDYMGISGDNEELEQEMFHNLMGYLIDGKRERISQYDLSPEQIDTFEKLRIDVLSFAEKGVEAYANNGMLLSDFTQNFGYDQNEDGSFSWYGEHNNQPKKIGTLEILANEPITTDKLERRSNK
jgi:hypothetical protein